MAEKVKIKVGYHIIIRDGKAENMMIKEGRVNKLSEIPGTKNRGIQCEGPFIIEVERD